MTERTCEMCGATLAPAADAGRPARYCSNACRQRAFRRRSRPGPRTAAGSTAHPNRFVGRRREMSLLRQRMPAAQLVTIIGPAGVGKTRMAQEFVKSLRGRQIHFVLLDSVRRPGQVLAAVGAALGVDGRRQPLLDAIVDRLSVRRCLLVLDNCEHLAVACAELTELLLARCAGLRILATSREPLGFRGEVPLRLGVLSLPKPGQGRGKAAVVGADAVRLFVDRARAGDPEFTVTEQNAALVAEICCRLDGLPLAIELAARQVGAVPLADVLAGLTDQLSLLAGDVPTGPARHRELRAAIAWSYRLLTAAERRVFRRICGLESDFDPAMAAVVAGSATPVLPVLLSLEAKSLVQRVSAGEEPDELRFRLLNTVRDFGLDRLAARGELPEVRDRLAGQLARIAAPTASSLFFGGPASVAILRERDNLLVAVEHTASSSDERHTILAVALARMWWHLHQNADGVGVLRRAIELDSGRTTAHHCDALSTLAWLTTLQHDYPGALRLAVDAVRIATHRAVPSQMTRALDILGRIHLFRDEFELAIEAYRGCVRHAVAHERPMCLRNLAWALVLAGARDEAKVLVGQALTATEALSLRMRGALLHTSGLLHLMDGEVAAAESAFVSSLKATSGHGYYAAYSLEAMALVAARRGDDYRASVLFAGAAAGRAALGLDVEPAWLRRVEPVRDAVAKALGAAKAVASVTYGVNLTPDHLVAHALDGHARAETAPPTHRLSQLTGREQEVAALVAAGLTNAQIARRLRVSASTVKTHLAGIRSKLDLRSRTQIAVWYIAVVQVS
ncbi:ATP-binding protein [Solwaraspora sp. WMMB335]|uniref:ATP-binding protein n=1 Tax=Solwaraspora sp. WMMB335 TaxID=3404118 RepID=UPI003B94DF49